ncbi:MAG TPA: hypothetical protein VJZ26_12535 [Blastocatellia bacterium]|nr:hypothetical protein [Blastocatellia bacterium]
MKNSPHISFDRIADLVEGRLASGERAEVSLHISACDQCSQLRARLARTMQLMRDDDSTDAPQPAISRAVSLFDSRKAAAPSGLRRLMAALTFDSLEQTPAFGMRSGEFAERHLLFMAGANKVHLQVTPSGEEWIVAGQVLGPCSGGEVEAQGKRGLVKAALNESCEFTLPSLSDGEYDLVLRLGNTELEIPELKLGG